ncbi:hypothetical protein OHA40_28870 [Nocardia sp. NBC_00508]|uniref:hypothetical protein n=1 Tax=Nocardia sp. NBC_00508 TaxID=2975992 RepID=UPI002E80D25B|nr:hypothetical protein [Nocardia sp. NBC_00508]WUD65588.1 hypothetical protein OHA40_28870 [Nocardia sp. NBC_00508]
MTSRRMTELNGETVVWRVDAGVIRVLLVQRADGSSIRFRNPPSLAECVDLMSRSLREQVRYQHERSRKY